MDVPTFPTKEFDAGPGFVIIVDAENRTWLKVKDSIHRVTYMSLFVSGAIKAWKEKKGET
jgi:hypothetical protein